MIFFEKESSMVNTNTIRNTGLITVVGTLIGIGVNLAPAANASFLASDSVSLGEILTVIAFVSLFFGAAD